MSLLLKNALLVEPDLNKVAEGNIVIRNGLIDRKDFRADTVIDCLSLIHISEPTRPS